ncbi:O-antigen ligase family protein [Stieleria sp. JC731]|uniref:O-antigen ligase family protein n=1 Tax=Pirellulaceae TaxID=2691357 RepID=UPI001E387239|nr:O-antigen ligase family protein [Stieleria sp. JC731]MCC9600588.1 O-antigen ligase family protein [Stieleria sp. JC731]
MAKAKQRVNREDASESVAQASLSDVPAWANWCRLLAVASLGGLLAYVAFNPVDSTEVERGEALWFATFAIVTWALTFISEPWFQVGGVIAKQATAAQASDTRFGVVKQSFGSVTVDVVAWLLAIWMMVSALAMCPPGNLRTSTNEAWFWVSAAAVLTSARRLLVDRSCRKMMAAILVALTFAMAVDACYEFAVTLPARRASYLADPDEMIRQAGIDAPRRSAARMVFANRLLDGGPTSTFLLANSLAAVLCVPVLAGVFAVCDWMKRRRSILFAVLGTFAILIGMVALYGTQSRSGLLSCIVAVVYFSFAILKRKTGKAESNSSGARSKLLPLIVAVFAIGFGFLVIGLMSGSEWIEAAPSSLLFRLQYWKSTVAMLADYPWLGVGPGSFQAMYLRYRLPQANETIADPHNFVFETLAAGGLVAGLLLLVLAIVLVRVARGNQPESSTVTAADGRRSSLATSLLVGAVVAALVTGMFSFAAGAELDLWLVIMVVVAATIAGLFTWRQLAAMDSAVSSLWIKTWSGAIVLSMLVHLCVSGGWTVPGVAMFIWLAVAMLVPQRSEPASDDQAPASNASATRASLAVLAIALPLLMTLRATSLMPVTEAKLALSRAEFAASQGMGKRAFNDVQEALQADQWDTMAAIWHSDLLKRQLVGAGDRPSQRQDWFAATEEVLRRCGVDPLARRTVAEQFLHVYQRFGNADDLKRASEILADVYPDNPTDVSLVAQLALVEEAMGRHESAAELAQQAGGLSKLGDNVVRLLGLQFACVVRPIGAAAANGPIREPVNVLFSQNPGWPSEP